MVENGDLYKCTCELRWVKEVSGAIEVGIDVEFQHLISSEEASKVGKEKDKRVLFISYHIYHWCLVGWTGFPFPKMATKYLEEKEWRGSRRAIGFCIFTATTGGLVPFSYNLIKFDIFSDSLSHLIKS